MKHLDTYIVHRHFKDLFTDHSHAVIPEWIEQRWPYEIIFALPTIDGGRVREIARKRMASSRCVV